jgi:transposase
MYLNLDNDSQSLRIKDKKLHKFMSGTPFNLKTFRMEGQRNYEHHLSKLGVRYHEVHVYRLLHKWGFRPKVPQWRFVNIASKEEKGEFKKRPRR